VGSKWRGHQALGEIGALSLVSPWIKGQEMAVTLNVLGVIGALVLAAELHHRNAQDEHHKSYHDRYQDRDHDSDRAL
jgi:hypothetical protein